MTPAEKVKEAGRLLGEAEAELRAAVAQPAGPGPFDKAWARVQDARSYCTRAAMFLEAADESPEA